MSSKKKTPKSTHKTKKDPVQYNIVLAGASGTGKSAVVNMIFDDNKVETSPNASGITPECQSIRGSPNDHPEISLRLVDTAGLDESLEGTVPAEEAMEKLDRKLNSLYSEDGVHLILLCIKKGRISNETVKHHQIVVGKLGDNQVPCLLVITRCETDEPVLGAWWEDNKNSIRNLFKSDTLDAVAVTTIKEEETMEDYKRSRQNLIEAIKNYALKEPWRAQNFREKLRASLRSKGIGASRIPQQQADPLRDHLQRPMEPGRFQALWNLIFSN